MINDPNEHNEEFLLDTVRATKPHSKRTSSNISEKRYNASEVADNSMLDEISMNVSTDKSVLVAVGKSSDS
jgi:hypothetical protein